MEKAETKLTGGAWSQTDYWTEYTCFVWQKGEFTDKINLQEVFGTSILHTYPHIDPWVIRLIVPMWYRHSGLKEGKHLHYTSPLVRNRALSIHKPKDHNTSLGSSLIEHKYIGFSLGLLPISSPLLFASVFQVTAICNLPVAFISDDLRPLLYRPVPLLEPE